MEMTILSPVRVAAAIVIVAGVLTGQSQPPVKPVRISGRVLDISNAVIPNSNVRLVMAGTGEIVGETKTDERGIYIITVTDRAPRQYELRLEARGFRPIVIPVMVMGKDMQLPEFFLQMIPEPYGVVVWP